MTGKHWIRQTHRWVSMGFTILSAAIFVALGVGRTPAQWVYFLPLFPLALLVLSGLYMFFLPYAVRWRGARPTRTWSTDRS
jgi:hypothetical protein